jgi:hypothetical protein
LFSRQKKAQESLKSKAKAENQYLKGTEIEIRKNISPYIPPGQMNPLQKGQRKWKYVSMKLIEEWQEHDDEIPVETAHLKIIPEEVCTEAWQMMRLTARGSRWSVADMLIVYTQAIGIVLQRDGYVQEFRNEYNQSLIDKIGRDSDRNKKKG